MILLFVKCLVVSKNILITWFRINYSFEAMGVHGLWKLIDSSGKPIPLEALENRILAVGILFIVSF